MKQWAAAAFVVLTMLLLLSVPVLAHAGGDQVQYGRPTTDVPYGGADSREGGDWGNPSNSR